MRPHAPAVGADAGPHQLRYPGARMDSDAEPIPDLVLHPGDTVTLSGDPHGRPRLTLSDADGNDYADLDCAPAAPDADRWRVTSIRWLGGRVLPVRALEQPEPVAHPHPDRSALPDVLVGTFLHAADAVRLGPVHTHRHAHHGDPCTNAPPGRLLPPTERYEHTHPHAHAKRRNDRSYHTDHEH